MGISSARAWPWPISTAMSRPLEARSKSISSASGARPRFCRVRPSIPRAAGCAPEPELARAMTDPTRSERRSRRRPAAEDEAPKQDRSLAYRRLVNPFTPLRVFSDDQVEEMHSAALRVLEELGMRILLPEARARFRAAGAEVDEASGMVRLDRGLVTEALAKAPGVIDLVARAPDRSIKIGDGHVVFLPVGGPPNVSDSDRG